MTLLDVSSVAVAAQAAAEAAGTATTGGMLAGALPAVVAGAPMGIDEVSMMLFAAAEAHAAHFGVETGLGVAQRGMFGAQVGVSGASYVASTALSAISLAL